MPEDLLDVRRPFCLARGAQFLLDVASGSGGNQPPDFVLSRHGIPECALPSSW
jgi:hypothetical protein